MDEGAHFHKCDFQVHTPRDINWGGAGAVTDSERQEYARELVGACREKGVQAVAITDHHDIAFFKYIREAALAETDPAGRALPPSERLVVFPGMELTLGIPCQAILLFDADLPVEFLPLSLTALGITPADASAAKHAQVQKLDIMSLVDLYDALNKLEPLRDRFIVFPHFADGGYQTLCRKGFEKHYASMPCVGGYLDGPVPSGQKSTGWRSITSGLDKSWGNKPIGVLQTSDSRSRDHAKLGAHVTWVKWARPTAEALRQACLARHSRISHTQPKLPPIRITRAEVSNSKFLGPITLDLNAQYNAIIGGRGTGKSTVLEYVRWALCDQPPADGAGEDMPDFQKRRRSLIEDTLLPLDAVVDVFFVLNEVLHVVRRKASGDLSLKIGEATFQACSEQNIRELLQVRAYSQKQLSAVGARLDELRRFVQSPIQGALDSLEERVAALAIDLRAAFDRIVRHRTLQAEIAAHDIEQHSLKEQLEKLRSSLTGLSADDTAIISTQAGYELEQRVVQSMERDANAAKGALTSLVAEFERLPTPVEGSNVPQNAATLRSSHEALAEWIANVRQIVAGFQEVFSEPVSEKALAHYYAGLVTWRQRREAHRQEYEKATQRAVAHEETLRQIHVLESRLAELNEATDNKRQQLARLADPVGDFTSLRETLKWAHEQRAELLEQQCHALTNISKSRLKATLKRAADIAPLADVLRDLAKGTKTRGERIDRLVERISQATNPLQTWHAMLDELYELAWVHVDDEAVTQLPPVPSLDSAGFTPKEKMALARRFQPPDWVELLLFDLKDLPVFEYQVRENDFISFEKASPGQQATALLSILLLQDGPPLLIDQPEDDLNMKIINEIVETLWQAKTHRQVVFVSHNANLVVNGDAELVVCCDYRTSATESGGQLKLAGAIDVPHINREIADVMEGGVDAFKLRYQKYGF